MIQYIKLLLIAVFAVVPYLNVQGVVKQETSIDSGAGVEVRQKEVRTGNRKNRDGERVRNNPRAANSGRNQQESTVNGDVIDVDPDSSNDNVLIEEVEAREYQELKDSSHKKNIEEGLQERSNRQRTNRDGERVRNNPRAANSGRNQQESTVNGDVIDVDPDSSNDNALIEEVEVREYQETEEPSYKKSREERLQERSNRQRRNIEER